MKTLTPLAVLVLALVACPARADDGYTYADDGYYYKDGYPYTRTEYYKEGYYYYYCGYKYYYPGYYYYKYYRYYPPEPKVSYQNPDWRAQLLDIAKQRDAFELRARTAAFEQANFLDAVRALGLEGNFRIAGYGAPAPYPPAYNGYGAAAQGSAQLGNFGVNAGTTYGYSFNSVASLYGDTNLNALYQQAARLTQNAQTLAGQAHTDFTDLAAQAGGNVARVASILAQGEAAQRALAAAQGPAQAQVTTQGQVTVQEQTQGQGQGQAQGQAQESKLGLNAWRLQAGACLDCHSGNNIKGKFDVNTYPGMTAAQKAVVWERLTTADESKRMPRTKDGKAGPRLTPEQLKVWMAN